ncbi:MAG: glycosyltransferase [Thermoproteota archaeon]|nr:glycosyltransferase [Thermoproteota archaeon]
MTKFIIIDNSIEDTVGHHYQYAAHCLKAALELGYDTYLATNKTYSSSESPSEWKSLPVYSYGFWDTNDSSFAKSLLNINRSLSTKVNQLKYKAMFSWIGFSWENRNQLLPNTNLPGEEGIKNPIPWIILSSLAVPLFMFSTRTSKGLHKIKKSIFNFSSGKQRDPISGTLIDAKRSRVFFRDTRKLFGKIKLERGDVVFVPTVGLTELFGFLEYFRKSSDSELATWHMLFRRNIYTGRDIHYWRQDEKLRSLRNALLHFIQNLEGQRVFFYTDTEELTIQYNRLGISSFETLPIPHTVPASVQELGNTSSLIITYIGDARTEKGYHFLPHLVHDLWSDYVLPGKIRFVFQSNFNMPKGEPKVVVARSELESLPHDKVELIYDPLSFDEYLKLLLKSNIVLLPYEHDNYYARSSGILIECLAAGIPVIVPSATWLSRQFVREIYRHHRSLYESMKVDEYFADSELSWNRHNSEVKPFVNGELIFGGESTKAYCWLEKPLASMYLYVSFTINAPLRSCIRVDLAQLRYDRTEAKFRSYLIENLNDEQDKTTSASSNYSSIFVPLEGDCHRIWLGFKNAFENKALRLAKLNVAFLKPNQQEKERQQQPPSNIYPMGAVGLSYDNPNEISGLLRDIIDNYQHYRKTALSFSRDYLKIHNAHHLVEEIQNKKNKVL